MTWVPPKRLHDTPLFAETIIRSAVPDDCARLTDLANAAYGLYLDRMERS